MLKLMSIYFQKYQLNNKDNYICESFFRCKIFDNRLQGSSKLTILRSFSDSNKNKKIDNRNLLPFYRDESAKPNLKLTY